MFWLPRVFIAAARAVVARVAPVPRVALWASGSIQAFTVGVSGTRLL